MDWLTYGVHLFAAGFGLVNLAVAYLLYLRFSKRHPDRA